MFVMSGVPQQLSNASQENEECTNPTRDVTLFITPIDKLMVQINVYMLHYQMSEMEH
jgi:hypothetical protein